MGSHDGIRKTLGYFPKEQEMEAGKMYDKFIIFKYQSNQMSTNGLLTSEEIEEAFKTDPTPIVKKSEFGLGIQRYGNKFVCFWRDNSITHRSTPFDTPEEAVLYRKKMFRDIKIRERLLVFNRGIKYNSEQIPIITTNKISGTPHDIKVDECIYYKLAKYNWCYDEQTTQITTQKNKKKFSLTEMVLQLFKRKKQTNETVDHLMERKLV